MKAKETLQVCMDCRPLTSGIVSDPKPAALRWSAPPFPEIGDSSKLIPGTGTAQTARAVRQKAGVPSPAQSQAPGFEAEEFLLNLSHIACAFLEEPNQNSQSTKTVKSKPLPGQFHALGR